MNKELINEINKCLHCDDKLCSFGCPLGNNIPEFIQSLKHSNLEEAYQILSKTTVLPFVCGSICPHDVQCQRMCAKKFFNNSVKIGKLEAYVGKFAIDNNLTINYSKESNKNVLIIGGGPSGLTCAAFLKRSGINVTIMEKHNYLGGLLIHGIPEFRLNSEYTKKTIKQIIDLGIEVIYNQELGKDFELSDVIDKYDAIYLGIGTNFANDLNLENENLPEVIGGNELLEEKIEIDFTDKKVFVYGGGNVAMDVSRTIKRKNAKEVTVIYRKDAENMKASPKEVEDAKADGVKFLLNTKIINIIGQNNLDKIEVVKTKFITEDDKDKLIDIENSNQFLKCDYLIKAIGSHPNNKIIDNLQLELDKNGRIDIDGNGQTSNPKIFAGGDVAGIKGTVAWASRSGRNAAYEIIKILN